MVVSACASDVEQMSLSIVDFLKIRVVRHTFDSRLQRNNIVITGHNHDRAEFKALSAMHSADCEVATRSLKMIVEHFMNKSCLFRSCARAIQLRRRSHE